MSAFGFWMAKEETEGLWCLECQKIARRSKENSLTNSSPLTDAVAGSWDDHQPWRKSKVEVELEVEVEESEVGDKNDFFKRKFKIVKVN